MNIGCVQFDPALGAHAANRARADALLDDISPGSLDLLILPEMAFTGYCFKDRAEIEPHCEHAERGATADWCRATARRLRCHVACGFPERGDAGRLYNSMLLVDPDGATEHLYRKHFLYAIDETWATEGDAFGCRAIAGLGRCAFAICMDLNPRKFEAPFDRYEFASSLFAPALQHREAYQADKHRLDAQLVIACNNWLRTDVDKNLSDGQYGVFLRNYWAGRLLPALGLPVVVAIANRVGVERGTRFAGASCVIDLQQRKVLGHLNGSEEAVLVVNDVREYSR
jgi:protein N-terminal amidase